MTDLNFPIIDSENIDTNIPNLNYYLTPQSYPLINLTNVQENTSVDFYLNKIFTEASQPLPDIYPYHHLHVKHAYEQPSTSLPFDDHSTFSLEIVTCGMQKNTRLPVPFENISLTNGCFGDDAGFATQKTQENFLGISDGASGNLMYGHDPRLFSESLMRNCSDLAHTGQYPTSEPKRLLCHAFDRVQNENCFGSATACVLGINSQTGRLYSVNIGDSGYVIIRQGCVIYRSRSQEMNGDCPRQLDVYPWTSSLKRFGVNYTQISSLDAICQTFDLELNDIIILSTDGLFDNVPDHLIEQILSQSRSLQQAANELVIRAVRFYVKPDDILVIMARACIIRECTIEQSRKHGDLFASFEPVWSGCYADFYLTAFDNHDTPAQILIDVGANKAYAVATWLAFFLPELDINQARLEYSKKTKLQIHAFKPQPNTVNILKDIKTWMNISRRSGSTFEVHGMAVSV